MYFYFLKIRKREKLAEVLLIENNLKELLNPIGDRLKPENEIIGSRRINENGYFGHKKKKKKIFLIVQQLIIPIAEFGFK